MTHSPEKLVSTFLNVIENKIVPLTEKGVASGSKVFGAGILKRDTLEPVWVSTNSEAESPLWHGETYCIHEFFTKLPKEQRPDPKDCIFLTTHEPCSMCLSTITWSGFTEFYYLFTYEDSRDLFAIPYDIRILEEVYRVPSPNDTQETLQTRPLYNRDNKFFKARSFQDLVSLVDSPDVQEQLGNQCSRIKLIYDGLSQTYQTGKTGGVETSAVWK